MLPLESQVNDHEEREGRARKVLAGKCPDCGRTLVPSVELGGCWIHFHHRCPRCCRCWRADGSARSCGSKRKPENLAPCPLCGRRGKAVS